MVVHNYSNSTSRECEVLFWPLWAPDIHMGGSQPPVTSGLGLTLYFDLKGNHMHKCAHTHTHTLRQIFKKA